MRLVPIKDIDSISCAFSSLQKDSVLFFYSCQVCTTMAEYERVSSESNSQSLVSAWPYSSSTNCNSFKPHTISNLRNFHSKQFGNEDEFISPISSQVTTPHCRDSLQSKGKDKLHQVSYTMQLQGVYAEKINESNTIELKSRQYLGNLIEESPKACQSNKDHVENSMDLTLARVRECETISSTPSNEVQHFMSLKRKHESMSQESRSCSVTDLKKLHSPNAHFNSEHSPAVHAREALNDGSLLESRIASVEEISSERRMPSDMRSILGANKSSYGIKKSREINGENFGVIRVGSSNIREYLSDMTMVESRRALDIYPDHLIGILGEQQFCETRKAIVNQQRVFAVQLFELHRVIKVQRLIAGSPERLFQCRPVLRNPAMKISTPKNAPLELDQEPSPSILSTKYHAQKPCSNIEWGEESALGKLPLPFVNNETNNRGLVMQKSNYGQHSRITSLASEAIDSKPTSWCFQTPPGNMWLVPVMSPSRGLTYKPFTGPCPPTGGFTPSIYGSCDPIQTLDPGNKNYLNAAYGVPLSYQQGMGICTPPLPQPHFPAYAAPVINQSCQEKFENPLSFGEFNFTLPHQSTSNMSSQKREAMSHYMENNRAPVVNELQGSTPSSPSDRNKGNVLPLFPTAPQVDEPADQNVQISEHQTSVIKAIPRSLRSATESAARIYMSIQQERK